MKIRAGLLSALLATAVVLPLNAQLQQQRFATLPGHIPGALPRATHLQRSQQSSDELITLCVLLNLSDEAAYEAFDRDLKDPASPGYHKTISLAEFAARFGPTQEAYDAVLAYLQQNGLTLAAGSANRRTLTVSGTRSQVESVFHVNIEDYRLGNRTFHANANDPAFPVSLAPLIAGV